MDLFAPSYIPVMVSSHQPSMSGLSLPSAAPVHAFGRATAIHFGALRPLHATPAKPLMHGGSVEASVTPATSSVDGNAALDTTG